MTCLTIRSQAKPRNFVLSFAPMNLAELTATTLLQAKTTPMLEWIAIIAAVAEVILARYNKILLYPAGIISTLIYSYLFLRPSTRLYADAILNVYYFVMSVYGWVYWSRRSGSKAVEISRASPNEWITIVVGTLGGWGLLYMALTKVFPALFTGYVISDMAAYDALISATAWVGMWLLTRRKIENWLLLNISNFIAIPVYYYKGMTFTAALTIFLFIVAIFGYLQWEKEISTRQSASPL